MPDQFTFGLGSSTNGQARTYLGLSWRFARAASLTLGGAGGNVKRLSRNIDPADLGDTTDPEAARRDVFDTSWMLGITVRIGGE